MRHGEPRWEGFGGGFKVSDGLGGSSQRCHETLGRFQSGGEEGRRRWRRGSREGVENKSI